jgi:hypothetical protein
MVFHPKCGDIHRIRCMDAPRCICGMFYERRQFERALYYYKEIVVSCFACYFVAPPIRCQILNKLPTPVRTDTLETYLQDYDLDKKRYLLNGFRNGFSLEYTGSRIPYVFVACSTRGGSLKGLYITIRRLLYLVLHVILFCNALIQSSCMEYLVNITPRVS